MAKTLRLKAAQLTDVGRRRERNQDNVTHFIPSDERTLEEKGAIFVVCDGMGGHAAGEVAAELGVNTIRDVYYQADEADIISSLARSVEDANTAIFQHAVEHPELAGMGTTCVGMVLAGGRAYIVNIGDSRAYIIRDGHMRQVTRDHSWVAEQVRIGLLSEEQARTHSHRNVITRSLGTQPTVVADLFVETMRSGDRVLICSDGLHGYVDEGEIARVVIERDDPDEAARQLIEMANANGGPDNITALIVHLLDVPEPSGELALPDATLPVQGITQPLPAVTGAKVKAIRAAKKQKQRAQARQRRQSFAQRLVVSSARLVAALLVVAIGVGVWYVAYGPYAEVRAANERLTNDIAQAQRAIATAKSQDPANALALLASTRQQLVNDLNNTQVDVGNRGAAEDLLQSQLQPAVRDAIQRYNQAALVTPVRETAAIFYTIRCGIPFTQSDVALTGVTSLVAVVPPPPAKGAAPPATQLLYALSAGQLYQVTIPVDASGKPATSATCVRIQLKDAATVVAISADGGTLYALGAKADGQFQLIALTTSGTNSDGTPKTSATTRFAVPTKGETPAQIAAQGQNIYIAYTGGTTGPGLWQFTGKTPKSPSLSVALPRPATSLVVTNGTVYLLTDDGTLGQLDASRQFVPLPVSVPSPVVPAEASNYSVATPVPTTQVPIAATATTTQAASDTPTETPGAGETPTATPGSGSGFAGGATLAVDPLAPTHLLIGDSANNRVVRVAASATGPGAGFAAQYVYGVPIRGVTKLAVSPATTQLFAYTWNGSALVAFPIPETAAGA